MQYVDSRDLRKARGAFFTPEPLAAFIAGWALRDPADSVERQLIAAARAALDAWHRRGLDGGRGGLTSGLTSGLGGGCSGHGGPDRR